MRFRKSSFLLPFCLGLCLFLAVFSLFIGRFSFSAPELWQSLFCFNQGSQTNRIQTIHSILWNSRLPRILAAICVGAALSTSGAAYQAIFRNPLVSPGLLGVLAGSGFGAALSIIAGFNPMMTQLCSFLGGIGAVFISVLVQKILGHSSVLMLIFGGLISAALFTALLSILKYIADPESQLPDIVFWLLGSLTQISSTQLALVSLPVMGGILGLSLSGRLLDALSMGDDEAYTLGLSVNCIRYTVIAVATMLAALTVSMAGMIGWVGLVVPHIARLIGGTSNQRLIGLSAVIGAIFLLLSDDLARCLSPEEIPVGIITDLVGCLLFLWVLASSRDIPV
ncbi:MAG: iron ABC transporter permease [Zymomonas mobilis]|uniref:Iron complex transport system permease protein n=1 Tax=Zymomonas mobilis TaxID=542 RepID=A0A542W3I0_ZYMMB|nr:iron ABC transporter permease [Zymomonas mobilis]TQL18125.1 iron complex transport system permease protein [Zymomonas mobilis]